MTEKRKIAKHSSFKRLSQHMPSAKLTMQQAQEIRDLLAHGEFTARELADMYEVAPWTIYSIKNGRTYNEWRQP